MGRGRHTPATLPLGLPTQPATLPPGRPTLAPLCRGRPTLATTQMRGPGLGGLSPTAATLPTRGTGAMATGRQPGSHPTNDTLLLF